MTAEIRDIVTTLASRDKDDTWKKTERYIGAGKKREGEGGSGERKKKTDKSGEFPPLGIVDAIGRARVSAAILPNLTAIRQHKP